MVKKTLGQIKLEWSCPNCGTRNPGPQKTCLSCGNPQPEQVAFEKPQQDVLISDQKEHEQSKTSPDIHCPYCGTRNSSIQKVCTQCGGDLTGGKARATGQILGALQPQVQLITCPNCSTENPATSFRCSNCGSPLVVQKQTPAVQAVPPAGAEKIKGKINPLVIIIPAAFLLILCIVILGFLLRQTETTATVIDSSWMRSINIEQYGPVQYTGWRDQIPWDAQVGACSIEYRYTSDEPIFSATEVCGTPFVVDEGTGYGEVVEECVYEVYDEKCSYSVNEWYIFNNVSLDGVSSSRSWPDFSLLENQRTGASKEVYTIRFRVGNETINYSTSHYFEYTKYSPGSEWVVTVDGFNNITKISPAD